MATADGQIWSCTVALRFVERDVLISHADCMYPTAKTIRVLQQLWVSSTCTQEWRDVPLEKEEAK